MIDVVGISPDGSSFYPEKITNADILIAAERLLLLFSNFKGERIPLSKNLESFLNKIEVIKDKNIVFLASNDPLFFGVGKKLVEKFGREGVRFYPYFNSVQLLAAKAKTNYEDCINISFHGRSISEIDFISKIKSNYKISILTDPVNNIKKVAEILIKYNLKDIEIILGQMLDSKDERVIFTTPELLMDIEPTLLDTLILINKNLIKDLKFGYDDETFIHENGLITKRDIRVVTLSYLELAKDSTLWDIGAGSGSVSIEASFFADFGKIYAIEKSSARVSQIEQNIKKFNRHNVFPILGSAPDIFPTLPKPDRVFIGGNSGGVVEIVDKVLNFIKDNGIIVINLVSINKLSEIFEFCKNRSLKFTSTSIQIGNLNIIGEESFYFSANNQVYIVKISL